MAAVMTFKQTMYIETCADITVYDAQFEGSSWACSYRNKYDAFKWALQLVYLGVGKFGSCKRIYH